MLIAVPPVLVDPPVAAGAPPVATMPAPPIPPVGAPGSLEQLSTNKPATKNPAKLDRGTANLFTPAPTPGMVRNLLPNRNQPPDRP